MSASDYGQLLIISARRKRRDFDLLENARALLLIDHVIVKSALALFRSRMRFERSVAFARCSCLKLDGCKISKVHSVRPKHSFRLPAVVTVAL